MSVAKKQVKTETLEPTVLKPQKRQKPSHGNEPELARLKKRINNALENEGIESELHLSSVVESGIPVDMFDSKGKLINMMMHYNVLPRNTLASARKSKTGRLSPANTERMIRVMRIRKAVEDAFGEQHIDDWLETPVSMFGNEAPMKLLASEAGARAVEIYLNRVKHGITA